MDADADARVLRSQTFTVEEGRAELTANLSPDVQLICRKEGGWGALQFLSDLFVGTDNR